MADDALRRNTFAVKTLYLFNLRGAQSCRISEYFINSRFSFLVLLPNIPRLGLICHGETSF